MSPRYGLYGATSKTLLTHRGRVIVHPDRDQLAFLVPGVRVVDVPPDIPEDQCIPLWAMPDFAAVRWGPNGELDRSQFRDPRSGS